MDTSIFLAKVFGLYLVILSLGMLFNRAYYTKAIVNMLQSDGVMFLTAMVTLILGILLVLFHNVWVADWRVVITILAWLTLVKGILRVLFPALAQQWSHALDNNFIYYISMLITLSLGYYVGYMGFFT